jgi:hypothetical protein
MYNKKKDWKPEVKIKVKEEPKLTEEQKKVTVAVMLADECANASNALKEITQQARLEGKSPLEGINSISDFEYEISVKLDEIFDFSPSNKDILKPIFNSKQPVQVSSILSELNKKWKEEWLNVNKLINEGALGLELATEWQENEAKISELKNILFPPSESSQPAPAVSSQETQEMLERLYRFREQIQLYKNNAIKFYQINEYERNVAVMLWLHPHWERNGIATKFDLSSLTEPDNLPEDATQRRTLFMDCLDLCTLNLDIKVNGPSPEKNKRIRILENLIDLRAMIFPSPSSQSRLKADELKQGSDNILRKVNALKCNLDPEEQGEAVSILNSVRNEHEEAIKQLMQQPWIKHLKLDEQGLDKPDLFNSMNLPLPLDKDNALVALENLRLCTEYCRLSAWQHEMLDEIQEQCQDLDQQKAFKDIKNSNLSKKVKSEAWKEVHKFIAKSEHAKDWKDYGDKKKKCRDELLKRLKSQPQLHPGSALGIKIGEGKQTDIIKVLTNLSAELPDLEAKYTSTDTNDSAKGGTLISKETGVYKAEFKPNGIVSITGPQACTQGLDAVLTVFKQAGVKAVDIEVIKKSDGTTIDDAATCAILKKAIAQDIAPVIMNKTAYQTLEYIQSKISDAAVVKKYITAVVSSGDKAAQEELINGIPGLNKDQKDNLLAKVAKKDLSVVSDILATPTPAASVNSTAEQQRPVNITPHTGRISPSVQRNSNVLSQTRRRKDEASVPSFTSSSSRSTSSTFFDSADPKGKKEQLKSTPSVVLSAENSDPNPLASSRVNSLTAS